MNCLPTELLEEILTHLKLNEFISAIQISSHFYSMINSMKIWKIFSIRDLKVKEDLLENFILGKVHPFVDWKIYYFWSWHFTVKRPVLEWKDFHFLSVKQKRKRMKRQKGDVHLFEGSEIYYPWGEVVSPRCAHTVNIVNDDMYILGGQFESTHRFNEIYKYKFKSGKVKKLPSENMPMLSRHQSCVYEKLIYVFGGFDGFETFNECSVYDTTTNEWHTLDCTGNVPVPRSNHISSIVGDYLYVLGGNHSTDNTYCILNDFYRLHIPTSEWTRLDDLVTGDLMGPRTAQRCITVGHVIYIFGGGEWSDISKKWTNLYNDIHIFDTVSLRFTKLSTNSTADLCSFTSVTKLGNYFLCFYGGQRITVKTKTTRNVFIFDTISNTWYETDYLTPENKQSAVSLDMAATGSYKNNVISFGGNSGRALDDWQLLHCSLPEE